MLENKGGVWFPRRGRVKIVEYFRSLFTRLLSLRDTPHAIAGGIAIGIFWGFTPLFGLKTLLCVATAWVARCSKLAAVLSVCLHDVITPLWPLLLRIEYEIGYWVLSHPHHLPPKLSMHHIEPAKMLQWTTFLDVGLPLMIGSIVIAIPSAAATYGVAYCIVSRRARAPLPPAA